VTSRPRRRWIVARRAPRFLALRCGLWWYSRNVGCGLTTRHDIPAAPTVAPSGPPERNELLPVDRRAASAPITGGGIQHDTVNEGGTSVKLKKRRVATEGGCTLDWKCEWLLLRQRCD